MTKKFNQFVIGPYMGNGAPNAQTLWLDDLLVTTSALEDPTDPPPAQRPAAPQNLRVVDSPPQG